MLVEDTKRTCKQFLAAACWEDTKEKRERAYTILVLRGKLQDVVR